MKVSNYGIKITTINSCIAVFTIKVKFNFDMRTKSYIESSMFKNCYFLVYDKNGRENLIINYATVDSEQFSTACQEFARISLNNKLDKMLDKTGMLSKTEISNILISKCSFNV
jgi:hypothetical protein